MTRRALLKLALALAVLALALPALPAAGQSSSVTLYGAGGGTLLSQQNIPASISGQITATFSGSAGAGCAAVGVCRYGGSVSWAPSGGGQLVLDRVRSHGRIAYQAMLLLGIGNFGEPGGATTANVEEAPPPGSSAPPANCSDASDTGFIFSLPVRSDEVAFRLSQTSPSLFDTRCAGPRDEAILSALPVPGLSLSAVRKGATSISLAITAPFTGDGFAGTVNSSLVLHLGRPRKPSKPQATPPGKPRHVLTVAYRAKLSGTVIERTSADSNAGVCGPLGACGASGTITLQPRVDNASGQLVAYGSKTTPVSALRSAVGLSSGRAPSGIVAGGAVAWSRGGSALVSLTQDGSTCSASEPLGPGVLVLGIHKRRLVAAYGAAGLSSSASPNGSCPGPAGDSASLIAAGEVPIALLRRRTITISLLTGSGFEDYGYRAGFSPDLRLTLTRVSVKASTVRIP